MAQAGVQLVSIDEQKSLSQEQQQEIIIPIASQSHSKPCPDLLNGTRKEYIEIAIPLYEASIRGDWKAAKEILDRRPELVRYSITGNNETALHVAASAKSTKEVQELAENLMTYMEKEDLELQNSNSNTALCLAAAAGNIKMVEMLVKENRALMAIRGSERMTPLYMAVIFEHYDVARYLYDNSQKLLGNDSTDQDRKWLFGKCVENDMFDIALEIVEEHPELGSSGSVLGHLARKTYLFAETESNIVMRTIYRVWAVFRTNMGPSEEKNKSNAMKLLKIIWKNIAQKPRKEIDTILRGKRDPSKQDDKTASKSTSTVPVKKGDIMEEGDATTTRKAAKPPRPQFSSRILFVATELGNTRIVIELIRLYPDLIWKVNDNNESIFHTAVKHRQEGIYNLLYEIGSMKDLIIPLKDNNDNNMLHLVGTSAKKKRLEDVSGVALQMQRELLWFKEVEKMIPRSYQEEKNKDGLTPQELFTKDHKDLVKQGKEWMISTASQCMVVAALIATIVFAAAFTVPGGYNQNDGIPFFYRRITFMVFVVADSISLFSSSASILMFLSILTSRYAERDFLESLPTKLMLGLATLFLSITTMMVAFSVSFFVLYHNELKWIPILITFFATMPVLLFAALQYPLLKDVIRSTYGSRYLFQPKKHVLYSGNSKSSHRWLPFTMPSISRCTSKIFKLL